MVLAKQRSDAHGRASLNEMKWNAAKGQTKKKKIYLSPCVNVTQPYLHFGCKSLCVKSCFGVSLRARVYACVPTGACVVSMCGHHACSGV